MYDYRKMTPEQRAEVVAYRRARHRPWHSPPHGDGTGANRYLITAACYEHKPIIGVSPARLTACEDGLLSTCHAFGAEVFAWCVLPNHYHLIVRSGRLRELAKQIGVFHGRSSYAWNDEEGRRGRKVWHRCFDRRMRSERHFWVTMNYVHHNPIYHGYVDRWQDWPWSSATQFLESVGREEASRLWAAYPILDYGKKWDV